MDYRIEIDIALPRLRAANILQVFQKIAGELAQYSGVSEKVLLDSMVDNEASDNSAMGHGVALPHIQLDAMPQRYVVIANLERPIYLDAPDGKPVDLIALLASPESDGNVHLRGLSRLSRLLKNEELCQILRESDDAQAMKALFVNPEGWLMAA